MLDGTGRHAGGQRMRVYQIRYTTADHFVLAHHLPALLELVRLLLNIRGARILGFGIADNHVHLLIEVGAEGPRRSVQAITQTLTRRGGQRLSPTWCRPIEDLAHLENALAYQLRQSSHHGLHTPDAFWPGSTLHDLIGARRVGRFQTQRLFSHLPRRAASDLLEKVGIAELPELDEPALVGAGPGAIVAAAARAVARVDLGARTREVRAARRAAVAVVLNAGMPLAGMERLIGVDRDTIWRDAHRPPAPEWVLAVRMQLSLDAVRNRGSPSCPRPWAAAPGSR